MSPSVLTYLHTYICSVCIYEFMYLVYILCGSDITRTTLTIPI